MESLINKLKYSINTNNTTPNSLYFQMATIGLTNSAEVRTVVFRGLYLDSFIKVITNKNSNKIIELTKNKYCQICWYFPVTREQYRIDCSVEIIDSSSKDNLLIKERKDTYYQLSDKSKEEFNTKSLIDVEDKNKTEVPENVVLLLLLPEIMSIDIKKECNTKTYSKY